VTFSIGRVTFSIGDLFHRWGGGTRREHHPPAQGRAALNFSIGDLFHRWGDLFHRWGDLFHRWASPGGAAVRHSVLRLHCCTCIAASQKMLRLHCCTCIAIASPAHRQPMKKMHFSFVSLLAMRARISL